MYNLYIYINEKEQVTSYILFGCPMVTKRKTALHNCICLPLPQTIVDYITAGLQYVHTECLPQLAVGVVTHY